VTVFRR